MKILVVTLGSIGDLLPFVVVGTALRARGHDVVFASNSGYEALIGASGFTFHAIWNDGTSRQTLDDVLEKDPGEAWTRIRRELFEAAAQPAFEFIRAAAQTGDCVILAPWSAFGAAKAHRELNIPLCTVYLSPHALFENSPRQHTSQATRQIAFFPEWFCPPRAGWPPGLRLTGFPMPDDADVPALPPELERFLKSGDKPVVVTPGTFMRGADGFFRESLAACAERDLRTILLTPYRAQLPAALPPTAIHFKYIALQRLLGRAAALMHHGGIGTTAQAMKAGLPQLVSPLFFDQFDNADRIEAMGVGKLVPRGIYERDAVAPKLQDLLQSPDTRQNCARVAANFPAHDPVREICAIVESLF